MAAKKSSTRKPKQDPFVTEARASLTESARSMAALARKNAVAVAAAAEAIIACFEEGGTVFFVGNGGSAADAQHLAAEFAGRYMIDRPGLPAVALTTNTSALTAIGNDYGYDEVFARQLEGMGAPGDVLVAITTSGRSESIRKAVEVAHEFDMTVIGMTGAKGADFAARCDIALVTPHASTPRIQEGHIAMGHAFCVIVERALFEVKAAAAKPAKRATSKRKKK
jgi:D-sedoheptulose 7-phosphate isomerase